MQEQDVPDGIDRRDQEYTVTVSWDYQGPPRLAGEYERQVFEAFRPPPGFSVDRDDEYFVTEDESRMLALAVAGAMLVMFLVLAVLYESRGTRSSSSRRFRWPSSASHTCISGPGRASPPPATSG